MKNLVAVFSAFGLMFSLGSCGSGDSPAPKKVAVPAPSPSPPPTSPAPPPPPVQAGKPNILLIMIDDLRPDLGVYGHPVVQTPNMDRFARSGATFDNAYVSMAVCAPSRAAMLTALRPDTTGIYGIRTPVDEVAPDAVTIFDHFKANGYETAGFGKVFHHVGDDADGWTLPFFDAFDKGEMRRLKREEGVAGLVAAPWSDRSTLSDTKNTMAAKDQLAEFAASGSPFLMAVGIRKPHLPFYAPQEDWDRYDPKKIPGPISPGGQLGTFPWSFASGEMWSYAETSPFEPNMPAELSLRIRWGYLAAISYVDGLVGELLAELDDLGLADDTIVVLWSDHGYKLGDYGEWAKHSNANIDTRIPLIIRAPGVSVRNSRISGIVESVDLYPTLADLAKIPVDDYGEGTSFRRIFSSPAADWKEAAFTQYPRHESLTEGNGQLMGYSVRTKDYRYTAWVNEADEVIAQELFNLSLDPLEKESVATSPGYQPTLDYLERLRADGWQPVAASLGE